MIIASIDIGTNTILMLIADYDPETGRLKTLLNEHRIPRIGKGLIEGTPVSDEKMSEMMNILAGYKTIATTYTSDKIIATATNAFRIASNSRELVELIKEETGIDVNIVSGEEESLLSYLGSVNPSRAEINPEVSLVIDIGGGSTEIITGKGAEILYRKSFNIGVVSATEKYFRNDPPSFGEIKALNVKLQNIFTELNENRTAINKSIAIAGTPTTLACIKAGLTKYNEDIIEGSILKKEEIGEIISELSALKSSEIKEKYKAVVSGREDVLLAGSLILFHLMNIMQIDNVAVSTKGIRYGAIIKEFSKG